MWRQIARQSSWLALVIGVSLALLMAAGGPPASTGARAESVFDKIGRSINRSINRARARRAIRRSSRRGGNSMRGLLGRFGSGPVRLIPETSNAALPDASGPDPASLQYLEVVKDSDALAVLVVGDWYAGGLAGGLRAAFAEETKLEVIDASEAKAGLAKTQKKDITAQVAELMKSRSIDIVVVMVGGNDRRGITVKKKSHTLRSDKWEGIYQKRIERLVETVQEAGKPIIWVGLPPAKAEKTSQDLAYFNGLFSQALSISGGRYVDIWARFLDEQGEYRAFGPDVNGLTRRLRLPDGTGFTDHGYRKVALFIESDLRRALRDGEMALLALSVDRALAGNNGQQVGVPIPLDEPIAAFNEPLAGDQAGRPDVKPGSPHHQLIVRGLPGTQVAGRADDFSWPVK